MRSSSRVVAALLAAAPVAAEAQVSTSVARAPTLTIERYPEDWSYLADPARHTGGWTEPFKYIPLSEDGSIYLSTGVEVRTRYESYANVDWGSARNDSFVWQRVMPYVDLHAGTLRVFVQPIFSAITGADRPPRPIDTTGADMLQGFVEAQMRVGERLALRLSAGRKLLSLGAGRLIDTRYGVNVPQAFDGVDATLTGESTQVTALSFRPVDNFPADLDDHASRQKTVWGLYATQWLSQDRTNGFDAYYLGLEDRNAVFEQGAGRATVHTYGTRFFGDTGAWFWNAEAVLQGGRFAGHPIAAWGVGGEIGRRFRNVPLQPAVSLTADVISGDADRDDSRLGTFNPLFPRGKYFGALSPIGPRNLIHLRPTVTVSPRDDLVVSLTGAAYWRQSIGDGIYAIPGILVRSGESSDARFIGTQIELTVTWQATPELNLTVSASAFEPGTFIRETGPARTIGMIGAMANYRF
ncbi:hypothetical protein ASF24_19100 [Methylobacterium sp. Leaf86]|uniref:alginate export family protein n=1 Tax=Methylobacterium sp. Leaf86 TaxID=1736242 RepID=UPI0006F36149|nr:alginate export family protein [Methylobacterium sp. Leaf86]KQO56436.1 hypothetical protein ASF24_19100 [Methylobacterium sp. Leaf86]